MAFTVTFTRSGRTFECDEHETVLDAATRNGIMIPYGCRNGACGSCRARLRAGQIDYGDVQPTGLDAGQTARGDVLLCQARAASAIEVDVEEFDASRLSPVRTLPVRVSGLERVAHDVMRLTLQLPTTERLQFLAGQYVEVLLRDGRRRAFSLANSPVVEGPLELHIRRVPDGSFSGHVFEGMRERALLRVHGPLGRDRKSTRLNSSHSSVSRMPSSA